MTKIYCHITQCNAIVQYFAILHAVRETYNIKDTFTLTFIRKNKRRSTMRQSLRQKSFVARNTDCRATESLCNMTKNFSHTIK